MYTVIGPKIFLFFLVTQALTFPLLAAILELVLHMVWQKAFSLDGQKMQGGN